MGSHRENLKNPAVRTISSEAFTMQEAAIEGNRQKMIQLAGKYLHKGNDKLLKLSDIVVQSAFRYLPNADLKRLEYLRMQEARTAREIMSITEEMEKAAKERYFQTLEKPETYQLLAEYLRTIKGIQDNKLKHGLMTLADVCMILAVAWGADFCLTRTRGRGVRKNKHKQGGFTVMLYAGDGVGVYQYIGRAVDDFVKPNINTIIENAGEDIRDYWYLDNVFGYFKNKCNLAKHHELNFFRYFCDEELVSGSLLPLLIKISEQAYQAVKDCGQARIHYKKEMAA